MNQTRVDTKKLQADVAEAQKLIAQAMKVLAIHLVTINDEERASIPKARTGFFNVLSSFIAAAKANPEPLKPSGFDADAAAEDAANVAAIAPLVVQANELAQLLADTQLSWTGEVFSSTLTAYRVASALVTTIPSLRTVVDVLAPLFARSSAKKAA